MIQSIGIDYMPGQWKVCRVEQGQAVEWRVFEQAEEMLALIRQFCTHYPEPTIVVALDVAIPFRALSSLSNEQLEQRVQRYHPTPAFTEITAALQTLRGLSARSYCAPSVEYLPTVPVYRYLMRSALGSAREVCSAVTLLHFMREQQAAWEEMNFLCVHAGENATSVLTIIDGQIVNGIDTLQGSSLPVAYAYLSGLEKMESVETTNAALQAALDEAFWEGLTQELSGLLAVHHIEDLVVRGQRSSRLVERLADTYQVYLFPLTHPERDGYEAALGAALLAEGLEQSGNAAAVVERLHVREAGTQRLAFMQI